MSSLLNAKSRSQKKQDNSHIRELENLLENDIIKLYDDNTIITHQCEDNVQKCQQHYEENIYITAEQKSNNTKENINHLKLKLKKIELERDIHYLKNEKLLNKLSQTHKQIELAQSAVNHETFVKLMHKTKRIKRLKQYNKENELKLQQQSAEMDKKNKSLKEMKERNNKCMKELRAEQLKQNDLNVNIKGLTDENVKLKAELLRLQQTVNTCNTFNKSIINKLQQNQRMIRYLQGFMDTKLNEYNARVGNKQSSFGKMDYGNVNGLCMIRVILIFIITIMLSVSWSNMHTYEESTKWNGDNMDMFYTMKHVLYEIYNKFMLSENIVYFVDFIFHSLK